jgi:hypothetical protein
MLVWALAAAGAVGIGGAVWLRSRSLRPAALLQRLPRRDALVLYVDFASLRQAGLLQLLDGSKVGQDAEYSKFVEASRFDYQRDLDSAVAAFAPSGRFLLLTGRFDWDALESYVRSQGGSCAAGLCRMTGSAPERRISFFPLRSNLMALAVSQDDSAALRMSASAEAPGEIPDAPLWLSVSASTFKSPDALPSGAQDFASALAQADSLTLAFAPDGARLAARMQIHCKAAGDATNIAAQLTRTTSLLRDSIARESRPPNPADLSGVLAGGSFRNDGSRVQGYWPVERVFVESLFRGQ